MSGFSRPHRGMSLLTALAASWLLTACPGGNGSSTTSSSSGSGSQLYVTGTAGRVLVYNDANGVTGNTPPSRVIAGGLTTLSGPRGLAIDMARNHLYVANYSNNSILVFHSARTAAGGSAPNRVITGAPLGGSSALFMDPVGDRLYVANTVGNSILIYDNASTLNGSVVATRTLSGAATILDAPVGIFVDTTRALLYVANADNRILIYANASSITGNTAPTRIISGLSAIGAIFGDVTNDRLYVAAMSSNAVLVFHGASTLTGSIAPNRIISGGTTQLNQPRDLFVDLGTDRLYVTNAGSNSVLVFNAANTVTGNATPNRVLTLTAATDPWGIFVDVTPLILGSTDTLDGYARSDAHASVSIAPATGDKDSTVFGAGWRQLYSFRIAGVPVSSTVTAAVLRLYQCNVVGSPYGLTSLGNVIVDHVNYGDVFDPFGSAYNSAGVALNIGTLSTTSALGHRSVNVAASVQNDLVQSRGQSQYRIRFSLFDTDFDFADDYAQFTDAEDSLCAGARTNQPPQLSLTLKP